jgi:uncharacterized protein YbjT (DUF2867 family)
MKPVVIAGGTGYLGRPLIEKLCAEGFTVQAIVRPQSIAKVPPGCAVITGDVLDAGTYQDRVPTGAAFVHLVGVAHPAPWKGAEFRSVDLASLVQSVAAARRANASRFVFVSVAHPAPVMKAYIEVRSECERIVRESGLPAAILRPWYILGPGHRWPYVLLPIYKVLESLPSTREGAIRLGLVTREQMVAALAAAVESAEGGVSILETAAIRASKPLRLAPR